MIYTLGESLLDVVISINGKTVAKPGGAMLNVSVSLSRAGLNVALISETGNDLTGKFIFDFLHKTGVDTSFINLYHSEKTSLALAFLDEDKKPSYSFYKRYPTQRKLKQPDLFSVKDILLFGSLYAIDPLIFTQISEIRSHFLSSGGLLIYDPNIRQTKKLQDKFIKKALYQNLSMAHIIKGSDEDFYNIFGTDKQAVQFQKLRKINPEALLIITKGEKGVSAHFNGRETELNSPVIKPVSTIGAGDAFSAGLIFGLQQRNITKDNFQNLTLQKINELLQSGIDFATEVCLSEENYIVTNI